MALLPTNRTIASTRDEHLADHIQAHKKLNYAYYDVKADFGAVGDGVTDDRQAIQNAVDAASAAGGGIVYAPPGTYLIAKNGSSSIGLFWASNVSLRGAGIGVTKFTASGSGYAIIKNTEGDVNDPLYDCHFENFEIDGSGFTDTSAAYSISTKGIYALYLVRPVFRDLYIHDCCATGLGVDYLNGGVIDNVVVYNNGRAWDGAGGGASGIGIGVGAWQDEPLLISNCHALENANFGIFCEYQAGQTYRSRYTHVDNCHSYGNRVGIGDRGASRMMVSNCSLTENTDDGFNSSFGGLEGRLSDCVIRGNGRYGIYLDSSSSGKWKFADNDIATNQSHQVYIKGGTLPEVQIKGNDIYEGGNVGILLEGTLTNLDISNNRVFNNGQLGTSSYTYGLRSDATITNLKCQGNRFTDTQGVKTQTSGMRWVAGSSVTTGVIENNDVRGNSSASIQLQGTFTSCVIRNNAGFDTGTTGNRPSAASVGAGTLWFDTTLGKPIFSTGSAWVLADGTAA